MEILECFYTEFSAARACPREDLRYIGYAIENTLAHVLNGYDLSTWDPYACGGELVNISSSCFLHIFDIKSAFSAYPLKPRAVS